MQYTAKTVLNRSFWLLATCQACWAIIAIAHVIAGS